MTCEITTSGPEPFAHCAGPRTASLVVVGEAWGESEERNAGIPFCGSSGHEFSKMLIDKQLVTGPKSDSSDVMPPDKFLKDEVVEVQQGSKFMKGRVVEVPGNKVQGVPNSSLYDVRLENGSSDSFEFKRMRRIQVVDSPSGGVLFIDEAYELNPANDPEGKKIFEELLNISENCRTTLSVILGGYRKEIEEKLFDFNPGAVCLMYLLACFIACHV